MFNKNDSLGILIQVILEKYPQHKQVLMLKAKFDNNQPLSISEETELKKFHQLLIK
jgi:hypothetical protein